MTTPHLSKGVLLTLILGITASGCSNSGGQQSAGGGSTGGVTAEGGSNRNGGSGGGAGAGQGGAGGGAGGTTSSGGQAGSGGATGAGGTLAGGGSSGAGGQAGGPVASGGRTSTGGQAGLATASGGQAGQAPGGAGGVAAEGGRIGSGGQAGRGSGGATGTGGRPDGGTGRSIAFGTLLDAQAVMAAAQELAKSLASPSSAQWQAKGDQHRTYHFAEAKTDEPYRLYVPTNWDGKSSLPLAMFLHGSGSDENSYVDQNNKQMLTLAQEHGYLLVAPLGDKGQYGNFLRLQSPFGKPEEAAKLMAEVTAESERSAELSEKDVINVLELVLAEYPIDRASMFLFGHSMGSGGTWYLGGKYAGYWKGLAPMSGPFVQETGYPWDSLRDTFIFVTEGTQTPSVEGSRALRDWLDKNGFKAQYKEVNADHGGMIKLVMPDVFDFFDSARTK